MERAQGPAGAVGATSMTAPMGHDLAPDVARGATAAAAAPERFQQLDALRGLAALSVVFLHYLSINIVYTDRCDATLAGCGWLLYSVKYSPLHVLFAGNEAVILFFILSGFVLYLSYDVRNPQTYRKFLVRRFFRINIPFYVACLLAFSCIWLLRPAPVAGLSSYFNEQWARAPDWRDAMLSLLFVFGFDQTVSVSPAWSLVYELQYSIGFPIVVWLVDRFPAGRLILGALVAAFVASIAIKLFGDHVFFKTFTFAPDFIIGACIAHHRLRVSAWIRDRSGPSVVMLGIAALLAYTYNWWLFPAVKNMHWLFVQKLFILPGAAMFIAICMSVRVLGGALLTRPAQFLGKLSYGIYLFHIVPVLVLGHVAFASWGYAGIVAVSLFATMGLACASWYGVEAPAIALAKRLTRRTNKALPSLSVV